MSLTDHTIAGRSLRINRVAALYRDEEGDRFIGTAKPFKELPSRVVRRLSLMEKGVISCLLGLGDDLADTPVVLTSRYGPMNNTLNLLTAICEDETMSPTAFSLSVHNAAIGVASQLAGNRGAHTAISAGPQSLLFGLVECEGMLAGGVQQVVLLYSDCRLPGAYAHFDDNAADLQMAFLLTLSDDKPGFPIDGATKAQDVLKAVENGEETLSWRM